MARLDVSLLGPFQVTRDATPLSGFAYDKVRALLAYLVVEADRPWRRETLASLFWPDQDDRSARHSLSQALFSLRKAIDDRDADSPLLLVTSDTVQLNSDAAAICVSSLHCLMPVTGTRTVMPFDVVPARVGSSRQSICIGAICWKGSRCRTVSCSMSGCWCGASRRASECWSRLDA
jgi:hypothetical protein